MVTETLHHQGRDVCVQPVLEEDTDEPWKLVSVSFSMPLFPSFFAKRSAPIILDEINPTKTAPSELIFDDFDHLFFNPGHPLGRRILGPPETVNA
jgi:predicted Zn-dependent peptidase